MGLRSKSRITEEPTVELCRRRKNNNTRSAGHSREETVTGPLNPFTQAAVSTSVTPEALTGLSAEAGAAGESGGFRQKLGDGVERRRQGKQAALANGRVGACLCLARGAHHSMCRSPWAIGVDLDRVEDASVAGL